MFRIIKVEQGQVKLNIRRAESNKRNKLECDVCGFIAKNENGLRLHKRTHKK